MSAPLGEILHQAARIVRGDGICEEPHRNGEANPHIHFDDRYIDRGRTLAAAVDAARAILTTNRAEVPYVVVHPDDAPGMKALLRPPRRPRRPGRQSEGDTMTEPLVPESIDLPEHVVVGANGAYWRDYGDHYSMCPVSEDNDPVEIVAVYVRAAPAADTLRETLRMALPRAINFRFLPPRIVSDAIWGEVADELVAALAALDAKVEETP